MNGILEQILDELKGLRAEVSYLREDVAGGMDATPGMTDAEVREEFKAPAPPEPMGDDSPTTELTLDAVRESMCAMVAEKGADAAQELLASFDAEKLSDVDPTRWAGLIEKAARWPMPKPGAPTGDEVKALLAEVMETIDRDSAVSLLKQFDAPSFSALKAEHYSAFAEEARKRLGAVA